MHQSSAGMYTGGLNALIQFAFCIAFTCTWPLGWYALVECIMPSVCCHLQEFKCRLDAARATLLPRRKFSFASKVPRVKAAAAPAASPGQQPTSEATSLSAGAASAGTAQQDSVAPGAPPTSVRTCHSVLLALLVPPRVLPNYGYNKVLTLTNTHMKSVNKLK